MTNLRNTEAIPVVLTNEPIPTPAYSPATVDGLPVQYEKAPENCRGSLMRYIEYRIPPGGFLTALLSNDLMDAIGRADHINKEQFHEIASWLYNYAPPDCFGSRRKVADWLSGPLTEEDGQFGVGA